MIENVTLGEIGLFVGYIVALITGIAFLLNKTKLWLKSALKDEFEPINKNIIIGLLKQSPKAVI